MAKLFWVEDQSYWVDKFSNALLAADFDGNPNHLDVFKFAEAAHQNIALRNTEQRPDLALLDANMNGSDQAGFSIARALRKKWPDIPILFLSEHSGTSIEEQAMTENRVQDFIAKNQRNVENVLCWRIKATLQQHSRPATSTGSVLCSGSLSINTETWDVFWKGTRLMNPHNPKRPLAPTPRKILRYLVERSPRPQSTEQIAELLDADPERFSYANYRQHIKTLRMAFEQAEDKAGEFTQLCKQGLGIVTFGDARAYLWKPDQTT